MNPTFIPLSQLDAGNLSRLAELHWSVMHTLLSDLGKPLVLRYYQAAQAEHSVIGFCVLSPAGQIDGWAMGSSDPGRLNARLRQPLGQFSREMIRLIFTRPKVLVDLLRGLISAADANQLDPGQIELTYIGVAPRVQGQGLGKDLLRTFKEAAGKAGYTSIALSVETDNPAAIGLYLHSGFRITKTFREGRFERYRMIYNVNKWNLA